MPDLSYLKVSTLAIVTTSYCSTFTRLLQPATVKLSKTIKKKIVKLILVIL